MIKLALTESCTGCSACRDVCPKAAITMRYAEDGFLYPKINGGKCIECHLCEKRCPVLDKMIPQQPYIKTYAGYTPDNETLLTTTSGGVATELSRQIISEGGVVAGVKYAKDNIHSEYAIATTIGELEDFKVSKYVQSEKNGIFLKVLKLLKDGRKVLFIGCPCDVAGLLNILKNTPQDNLLTCELVCMGVSSPLISSAYGKYIRNKYHCDILSICARSKRNGWFVPTLLTKLRNGKELKEPLFASYLGRAMQIYNRESCFGCKYRGENGYGDIRIGDFWGIKKSDEYWNSNGVSCIFARTLKGIDAMEALRENGFRLFDVDYATATDNNMSSTLDKGPKYKELSQQFYTVFQEKGLEEACKMTSDFGFRMKRLIPLSLQPMIKRIYHILRDK